MTGPDMNDPRFASDTTLANERLKVAALLAMLEPQGFGEDDHLILDAIEGETDAMEAVSKVLRLLGEDDTTFAPETYAVMQRRGPEFLEFLQKEIENA